MPLTDQELLLVIESDKGFEVVFVDDEDELEDLTGATAASFVMRETLTGSDLLVRRTDTATLTLDTANSKVVATAITPLERATLTAGVFLGFAAFKLASGKWYHAEPFRVRLVTSKAPTF